MTNIFPKDPNAVLDYQWDWDDWLAVGESITSYQITVPTGLTLDSSSNSGRAITAWLSSGTDGVGYRTLCHIVTSAGRTDDRSIYINVRER